MGNKRLGIFGKDKIMPKLKATDIIKPSHVAYHICGGVVDDVMPMVKSDRNFYLGKPVQQLIDDGWSFVCSSKDFKKGNKTRYTADVAQIQKNTQQSLPTPGVDGVIKCPHCEKTLQIKLKSLIQVEVHKQV